MHPWVLKELKNVIVKKYLAILEWWWLLGEVPEDGKKENVTPSSGRVRRSLDADGDGTTYPGKKIQLNEISENSLKN